MAGEGPLDDHRALAERREPSGRDGGAGEQGHDLLLPDVEQLVMEIAPLAMRRSHERAPVEHRAAARVLRLRVGDARTRLGISERGEPRELASPTLGHLGAEVSAEIAEEEK